MDPSIKVTYKPVRKYQQTTGLMSKSTVFSYHQAMLFKNTKAGTVKITITDQFPKSSTDKIKVRNTSNVIDFSLVSHLQSKKLSAALC